MDGFIGAFSIELSKNYCRLPRLFLIARTVGHVPLVKCTGFVFTPKVDGRLLPKG